jgi:YfiH family protein
VLVRKTAENGVVFYASALLDALGVRHGFSTRIGGVSPAPFDSLNLGNLQGTHRDMPENVQNNLQRFQAAVQLEDRQRIWLHQIHGNVVAVAKAGCTVSGSQGDALVSGDPTSCLLVRVADCVPILVSTPCGRFVAAIHAGWRGVVAEVVPAAIAALAQQSGTPSHEMVAAIGPCISREAFEVGPEVVEQFQKTFDARVIAGPRHVDLPLAVKLQLRAHGLSESQIDRTDRCTVHHRDEFFSHRRDNGITGRMAAMIGPVHT